MCVCVGGGGSFSDRDNIGLFLPVDLSHPYYLDTFIRTDRDGTI